MPNTYRLAGRFFSVLISLVFALALPRVGFASSGPTLCQISDTVYRADGTPAQGDVGILWTAFTTADGDPVAAGQLTVQLGAQGQFNASLAPNAGAMPAGTFYRVTYKLNDPSNPATLGAVATVLYDNVVASPPGFATYALVNETSLFAGVSYTSVQRTLNAEIRSMAPNGQFRTRLAGALADGGECYITSAGKLCFYAPCPPQLNEQIVVAYRSHGRAMARVQDAVSIAEHAQGGDKGQRSYVRRVKLPPAFSDVDCETAATALLDDSVQTAGNGEYKIVSDFLPITDVVPGDAVQVSAPSRGAQFSAIVRKVELQALSLADDRSHYDIKFANDADEPLAFEFEAITLAAPVATIYTTGTPSSSLYLDPLTAAQITNVIASQITIDAGIAPPAGGGIEVRRSDGGWGPGDGGNLAGRFTTQTFTLPRLSRSQGYYLRQYDGSSPAKYSRYSALLHVDYPL